jgi:hypothetical protein
VVLVGVGLLAVGALAGCGGAKELEGMVCIDNNIPKGSWRLVKNYLRYDLEQDYTSNLISAFEGLHTDLSEIDWSGMKQEHIVRNTDDLVSTVKRAKIEWKSLPVLGRGDPKTGILTIHESLLFAPLELALPTVAHEAHHLYLGSRENYYANVIDAERVAHWIDWKVWEQVRPCGQGMPEDEWLFVNYANIADVPEGYDDFEHLRAVYIENFKLTYARYEEHQLIAINSLGYQRSIIEEWGYEQP